MRLTKFEIDFLGDNQFEGYTRGEDWNGFACPYFTFEQAQQLADTWRESGSNAYYDPVGERFNFGMQNGETDSFSSTQVEGQKLYPIGNGRWIWSESDS
jgi:hypothetical protein